MYADGEGRMLVKVASLWPVVDASGAQVDQNGMTRYLSEMIWFPAAFLADNISFQAADDSSSRTADSSSPETWSTPITSYGEHEGLRLPVRGPAIWELPGGDCNCALWLTAASTAHNRALCWLGWRRGPTRTRHVAGAYKDHRWMARCGNPR
jgi:hypothetical protein